MEKKISIYADWGGKVKLTWIPTNDLPNLELITSVHCYCFYNDRFLMVELKDRGWEFPGGHLEEGESPKQCAKREALEEGYVEGECCLLGVVEIDHTENENWSSLSPYPKVGYQAFYRMDITRLHPFHGGYETLQRLFIDPQEIGNYYKGWNPLYQAIMKQAERIGLEPTSP